MAASRTDGRDRGRPTLPLGPDDGTLESMNDHATVSWNDDVPRPHGPPYRRTRLVGLCLVATAAMACGRHAATGTDAAHVAPAGPFRVVVISDLNGRYGSTDYGTEVGRAVALIQGEWRPDLVLAAGDLIAGQDPDVPDMVVRAMWTAFDSLVAAPLRSAGIPFGFTLGNHDASAYPAHARDRALAIEHWRAPARHPGVTFVDDTGYPLYYSIRQGPLFIVAWDATWEGTLTDTALIRWVQAQLASRAARDAPFRIVLGHLPLYAVAEGRDRSGEVLAEADSLRSLLEALGVHTYVSGHHHAYYPGRRGTIDLLHAGAVGDGPRPLLGSARPSPRTVTLLDFDPAALTVEYTTYALDGDAPPRLVPTETLPERVSGSRAIVVRRDIREE